MVLKDKSKPDFTTLSINCYSPVQAHAIGDVGEMYVRVLQEKNGKEKIHPNSYS